MANSVDASPFLSPYEVEEEIEESVLEALRDAIETQVKREGVKLRPGEVKQYVIDDAVEQTFYDVSEFYYWFFNSEDDRNKFMASQKKVNILPSLEKAVAPVVARNLVAMRDVNEIPAGLDTEALPEMLTDALVRYILNWPDWYWDRKEQEALDNYYEVKGVFEDIYYDSSYGDLSNLIDNDQYNGWTDVPYLSEEG